MKEFLLEAFPNPERKGCPDENTIRALAEDRLPAKTPARIHLGSCSECYAEYRHYRQDWEELQDRLPASGPVFQHNGTKPLSALPHQSRKLPLAIAASAMVVLGGLTAYHIERLPSHSPIVQTASSTQVDANVDLFNAPTLRGMGDDDAIPLTDVVLPAAVVHLSITLPRFSQDGEYVVAVTRDREGHQLFAKGAGTAVETHGHVNVHVTLDLRQASAGSYFLATVRGSDHGTYYYPLEVHR
jgi:hypothetical protein